MKKLLTYSLVGLFSLTFAAVTAEAKKKDKHKYKDKDRDRVVYVERDRDDDYRRDRSRRIYVIEGNRPVQREVYVGGDGRYYRYLGGRRVYVTGRHYDSFPSRHYYSDGRPRVQISF